MSALTGERWRALSPYLDQALELSDMDRQAWLESLAREAPSIAADVRMLIEEHELVHSKGFLEHAAEPAPTASLAGQVVGAYTLVSLIGQGGMGNVWLAERSDGRFTGKAAVKLLNVSLLGRAGEERFRREGAFLARLTHPNIGHLVDAGVSPLGQPYLVLEYVSGVPIDRYCDAHHLGIEARTRLFLGVLAAVSHAHANLIVHRDIKPSNVLVRDDGQVKLLDFGVAKLIESETQTGGATLTVDGGRALTPEYAAPEQLTGEPVTTATDVYALGVLLYVLLGGEHPAGRTPNTPADLVKSIVDTDPPAPSAFVSALRGDLDTIILKALKKQPHERYVSADALADDLQRYLEDKPIRARPDAFVYRARKFVIRNRMAVALASAALVALVAGLAGTVTQAGRASRQAAIAETQRDFAIRQLSRAEAINELDHFLLSDAAPSGKPFTVGDLLTRAERVVDRQQETDENRVDMLVAIGRQYATQDRRNDARRVLTRAYELSRQFSDPSIRAKSACALASVIGEIGPPDRAERLFREGLNELPHEPQYALHRVFCYLRGSEIARTVGEPREGVERAEAAKRLLADARMTSPVLQFRVSMALAESYRVAGRFGDAHSAFKDTAARMTSLGRDDTESAGTVLNNWALVLSNVGQPLEAEPLFRRAIAISSADGTDEAVSPMLLTNFARTLYDLHRLAEANGYAERACEKARILGNELALTFCLFARSAIYRDLGDLEAAARTVTEIERRIKTMPPGHSMFAALASQQALLEQARGKFETALSFANKAIAIASLPFQPRLMIRRSQLLLEMQQFDEGRRDAETALRLMQASVDPRMRSYDIGQAHLALGRIRLAQGDLPGGAKALRLALDHLEPTLGPDHPLTRTARDLLSPLGGDFRSSR